MPRPNVTRAPARSPSRLSELLSGTDMLNCNVWTWIPSKAVLIARSSHDWPNFDSDFHRTRCLHRLHRSSRTRRRPRHVTLVWSTHTAGTVIMTKKMVTITGRILRRTMVNQTKSWMPVMRRSGRWAVQRPFPNSSPCLRWFLPRCTCPVWTGRHSARHQALWRAPRWVWTRCLWWGCAWRVATMDGRRSRRWPCTVSRRFWRSPGGMRPLTTTIALINDFFGRIAIARAARTFSISFLCSTFILYFAWWFFKKTYCSFGAFRYVGQRLYIVRGCPKMASASEIRSPDPPPDSHPTKMVPNFGL